MLKFSVRVVWGAFHVLICQCTVLRQSLGDDMISYMTPCRFVAPIACVGRQLLPLLTRRAFLARTRMRACRSAPLRSAPRPLPIPIPNAHAAKLRLAPDPVLVPTPNAPTRRNAYTVVTCSR